jgi:hypothetical protein
MTGTTKNGGVLVDLRPMTPDEIERTVQFLLRQQAQFAADFEKLSAKVDGLAETVVALTGVAGQTMTIVGQLAEAQRRTDEQLRQTDARVRELAEHGHRTDARLDALIDTFERHLREDHGRPPS